MYRQTRWFEFFTILKAQANGGGLAAQLALFMKENKMSIRNQCNSIDSVALENFLGAKSLMDETLFSNVSEAFAKQLGKVSAPRKSLTELAKHSRYVIYTGLGKMFDFTCHAGYWLPKEDPTEQV